MVVTASPRGGFYIARHGSLAAFDRDRDIAIRKLTEAIWRATACLA